MREQYVEAVLAVAELIPPARVLSYGDIAALLESGGPRQVGAVMSAHGNAVPWWRVIRAGGAAPLCHEGRALAHYLAEDTALRGDTGAEPVPGKNPPWRVDMTLARWNPADADFDVIDAIAARLRGADGVPADVQGKHDAGHGASGAAAAAQTMSDPRDGLEP